MQKGNEYLEQKVGTLKLTSDRKAGASTLLLISLERNVRLPYFLLSHRIDKRRRCNTGSYSWDAHSMSNANAEFKNKQKITLNSFKLTTTINYAWFPNKFTIVQHRPNERAIQGFKRTGQFKFSRHSINLWNFNALYVTFSICVWKLNYRWKEIPQSITQSPEYIRVISLTEYLNMIGYRSWYDI